MCGTHPAVGPPKWRAVASLTVFASRRSKEYLIMSAADVCIPIAVRASDQVLNAVNYRHVREARADFHRPRPDNFPRPDFISGR